MCLEESGTTRLRVINFSNICIYDDGGNPEVGSLLRAIRALCPELESLALNLSHLRKLSSRLLDANIRLWEDKALLPDDSPLFPRSIKELSLSGPLRKHRKLLDIVKTANLTQLNLTGTSLEFDFFCFKFSKFLRLGNFPALKKLALSNLDCGSFDGCYSPTLESLSFGYDIFPRQHR